ncbi:MAG: phosphodiester glycosidase family protein [Gemmatimonadales bacterium]|nr:phosphodiester glycosidase family protein [Gemmatimonadales bacterium]
MLLVPLVVLGFLMPVALPATETTAANTEASSPWVVLQPGLELGGFNTKTKAADPEGDLLVVRVDLGLLGLKFLAVGDDSDTPGRNAKQWCGDFGLLVAINAGMYQADHRTHVGFCQIDGRLANRSANDYLSAVAWDPFDPSDHQFRIFDLDEVPLAEVAKRYGTVVQNLRLIKRERENRWQPSGDRWAEAALGEDDRGRVLLIYCATPRSMYELNEILLELPLGLVAAQHLEGRNQARMWVTGKAFAPDSVWAKRLDRGPVLPNVIGVFELRDD